MTIPNLDVAGAHNRETQAIVSRKGNSLVIGCAVSLRFVKRIGSILMSQGKGAEIGNNSGMPHVRSFERRDSQNNKASIQHEGSSAILTVSQRERALCRSHLQIQVRSSDEPFTWPER